MYQGGKSLNKLGLIHVYCGEGKGKTTSAMGLALRAYGNGIKIIIVQFLKNKDSGEISVLKNLKGITILKSNLDLGFTFNMTETQKKQCKEINDRLFDEMLSKINCNNPNLILLDEIIYAYNKNLINKEKFIDFLKSNKENTEIVLTGRNPSKEIIELADYVSEIKKIKHPYDKGIPSRKGIEF